jgi:hypothetical protein
VASSVRARSKHTTHLIKHPVLGSCKSFQVILRSTSLNKR